jgi:hypothetical protein
MTLDISSLLDSKGGVNATKVRRDPSCQPLLKKVYEQTSYLPADAKLAERLYHLMHGLNARPTCPICRADLKLKVLTQGYNKYCSSKCASSDETRSANIRAALAKLTNEQKQVAVVKAQETHLLKHGTRSPLQVETNRIIASHQAGWGDKVKATSNVKYGVDHYMQLGTAKARVAQTHRLKKLPSLQKTISYMQKLGYEFEADVEAKYLGGKLTTVKHLCGSEQKIVLRSDVVPACHECLGKNSSDGEHAVQAMVMQYLLDEDVRYHDRTVIAPYELDCYLPKIKLGIEFHGCYWYSEERINNKLHQLKALKAKEAGIRLVQVLDASQLPMLEQFLSNACGISTYARKLQVRSVDNKGAKAFLEEHHRQQACKHELALGLYAADELKALMMFGKPRFDRAAQWELLRFCTAGRVVGAASKLFKAFIRLKAPTDIISYANLLWSNGNVYERLGFSLTGITDPGYVWVSPTRVLTRFQTQKHKLASLLGASFDPELSEAANMGIAGYHKVYDAGNLKYTWVQG